VLIFSIFASEWGSGRKYLKNERRASPSPKEKKKGGKSGLPKPPPRGGWGRGGEGGGGGWLGDEYWIKRCISLVEGDISVRWTAKSEEVAVLYSSGEE